MLPALEAYLCRRVQAKRYLQTLRLPTTHTAALRHGLLASRKGVGVGRQLPLRRATAGRWLSDLAAASHAAAAAAHRPAGCRLPAARRRSCLCRIGANPGGHVCQWLAACRAVFGSTFAVLLGACARRVAGRRSTAQAAHGMWCARHGHQLLLGFGLGASQAPCLQQSMQAVRLSDTRLPHSGCHTWAATLGNCITCASAHPLGERNRPQHVWQCRGRLRRTPAIAGWDCWLYRALQRRVALDYPHFQCGLKNRRPCHPSTGCKY
eukprot:17770-Chlamydomonas_euryale.AAC.1